MALQARRSGVFNPWDIPLSEVSFIGPDRVHRDRACSLPRAAYLYALDPRTGKPATGFGNNGKVTSGGVVAPAVYQDVIVVANWNVILGYDIQTGRQLWSYDVLGKPAPGTEEGADRGGNCWGGIAMDTARGIVYASTGSAHPNFLGMDHPGLNEAANSVIALEAKTGRLLWLFQEIRHDIWDMDIPAPPNLVTITHHGKRVDAVAQVTKLGNTLLLDRLTGKSLFPYRLRRAPTSKLPGERTSPYQPVFDLPQPFVRQIFTPEDVTNISPQAHEFVSKQIANANYGWFQPFEAGKPTVYFGVHGGAQWTGAAFDPASGILYVSANELPWIMTIVKARAVPPTEIPITRHRANWSTGRRVHLATESSAKARACRPRCSVWEIECWTMRLSTSLRTVETPCPLSMSRPTNGNSFSISCSIATIFRTTRPAAARKSNCPIFRMAIRNCWTIKATPAALRPGAL